MRRCGHCKYFVIVKSYRQAQGMCDKMDIGVNSEYGRRCQVFKPRKYRYARAKTK